VQRDAGAEHALHVHNAFRWGWLPDVSRLCRIVVQGSVGTAMRDSLKQKIITVCDAKIAAKGPTVGLSFYAFFANRNDDPELLMEAATWWIRTHRLDHFEKAEKVKALVLAEGL